MNLVTSIKQFTKKRTPEILIATGLVGMVTSVVFAVKAVPKAEQLMEKAKENKAEVLELEPEDVNLTVVEKVKAVWTVYAPSAIAFGLSTACIIGANNVSHRRSVAIATAYTLSETAFKEYKEKVVEKFGKNKEQQVRDEVAKAQIEKNPVSKSQVIITGNGDSLCYDSVSGRYFKSNIEKIRRIVNDTNQKLFIENWVSLNEFYIDLGLETIAIGNDMGWSIDKGGIDIDFSSHIADDGTPCLVLDYTVLPTYGVW